MVEKESSLQQGASSTQAGSTNSSPAPADTMQMLIKRVAVLEMHKSEEVPRAIDGMKRLLVSELKTLWRARVLDLIKAPIKNVKATRWQPFGAVVRGDSLHFKVQFAYRWFSFLVDDISERVSTHSPNMVTFIPSLSQLVAPPTEVAEGHVIFSSARTFLQLLGISLHADFKRRVQVWRKVKGGTQAVRFLGGLQWTEGNHENPMRMFIGHSCLRNSVTGKEQTGGDVEVVEFGTAQWDMSNGLLASAPIRARACRGQFKKENERATVFKMSWRWKGGSMDAQ